MERCPECGSTDVIVAELDQRGCRKCNHWWAYDAEADAKQESTTALIAAWQHLHHLLHHAPNFPDAERHETAVTLDLVTGALEKLGHEPSF